MFRRPLIAFPPRLSGTIRAGFCDESIDAGTVESLSRLLCFQLRYPGFEEIAVVVRFALSVSPTKAALRFASEFLLESTLGFFTDAGSFPRR